MYRTLLVTLAALATSAACADEKHWSFAPVTRPAVPAPAKHTNPIDAFIAAKLGDNGLSVADVRSWAVHPGGPKILTAVEECLELPKEALAASWAVYSEYGNMSSPTVLFVLDRLRRANAPRPCVALGFGPGLVAEATLFV